MSTLNQNITQAIRDFDTIKDAIEHKGVEVTEGTPTSNYGEKIGQIETGITPTGKITITENTESIDITDFAEAEVAVPQGVFPEGTVDITTNGTHDVTQYANAFVAVPQPSGKLEITENGNDIDISQYEFADVNVSSQDDVDAFIRGTVRSIDSNVDAVPDFAFSAKSDLEEVSIPNATYIGKYAFSSAAASSESSGSGSGESEGGEEDIVFNNKKLTTVNMPVVTHIDKGAFKGDENLEITELPDSIMVIEDEAFKDCPKVQLTSLPDNLTYIGDNALDTQENFPFDAIPNTLMYIGSGFTFEQLREYISQFVIYENGVLDLSRVPAVWIRVSISNDIIQERNIFTDNFQNVQSIIFPDSVTSIGDYAFNGCQALTDLTIPDSVTSIGDYAFNECRALTSLTIPDSVTSIGDGAFRECRALTSLTIPDSVTSIGDGAFNECRALTSLTIPDSVTSIGGGAFYGCNALTSLTIPDSVTSIGDDAFNGCQALTDLTIPDSVTSIGNNAFKECQALTDLTIPDSVTSIGNNAFRECRALTSLTIGNSVTSIGGGAFYRCQTLVAVDMTAFDGSDIPTVGSNSFYADSHSENFAFVFASQEVLDAFAAYSNWATYSQYFEVQSA